MKFVLIPAGQFMMGSPDNDVEAFKNEKPQHLVRITRPFYLAIHEVTQAEYESFMGNNPSHFSATGSGGPKVAGQPTAQHPVEQVSWLDAVAFCNILSEKEGLKPFYELEAGTARVRDWAEPGYRLPTEAEWEYACRGEWRDLVLVPEIIPRAWASMAGIRVIRASTLIRWVRSVPMLLVFSIRTETFGSGAGKHTPTTTRAHPLTIRAGRRAELQIA